MKKPGREGRIAVIVGTVTDDTRIWEVPKLTVSFLTNYFYISQVLQSRFCFEKHWFFSFSSVLYQPE